MKILNTVRGMMIAMSILIGSFMEGCFTKIEPGYAGILVNNMGDGKGIQDLPVLTGFQWYNPFITDVHVFPTFQQRVIWTASAEEGNPVDESIAVTSSEGSPVKLDVAVALTYQQTRIPHIFAEFKAEPEVIINGYVRDRVRFYLADQASHMKVVDIFGSGRNDVANKALLALQKELDPKGIMLTSLSITGLTVSEKVQESIQAVVTNQQRANAAEASVREKQALAAQKVAEASGDAEAARLKAYGEAQAMNLATEASANQVREMGKAQADAARLMQQQVTRELVEYMKAQRWDGKLPQYNLGSTSTFMSLPAAVLQGQ